MGEEDNQQTEDIRLLRLAVDSRRVRVDSRQEQEGSHLGLADIRHLALEDTRPQAACIWWQVADSQLEPEDTLFVQEDIRQKAVDRDS